MLKFTAQVLVVSGLISGAAQAADETIFSHSEEEAGLPWRAEVLQQQDDSFLAGGYLNSLTDLSTNSIQSFSDRLADLYQETVIFPGLEESFFPSSDLYQAVTIPVASVSRLDSGYQIEFISQFYDAEQEYLLHMQPDSLMYDYVDATQSTDLMDQDIAIGLGASFILNKDVTIQTLLSSGHVPQYSGSNFAVGLSVSF